ncbi:tetratricopeptide repeat protein [Novipirellula sp.]|uniref:tetratricopeptide repeat protein n=1 Tax=Novipirellula sp. TaxID=2795430 RepID=UPI0035698C88
MNHSIKDNRPASAGASLGKTQLRFTDEQFIWRFSPNQTDPELLEAIFVGREPLLQNILEKIADAATSGSTHHVLLHGPRGIGKSHFTSLLHHRLLSDRKLSEAVHIAHLNEDETTTSMVQLLVRIYSSLCKAYPDAYSAEWLDELLNQPTDEITRVLTRRLTARFETSKLVILVENLNLLFENLGTAGQHELRTFLQEHPFACVIATSQQLFKAVTDRSEPFFGFFQQIPLKPLSLQDAQSLLAKIARAKGQDALTAFLNTPDGRGRVRAIHDLAGGNHRVYIVLSGFVTRESLDQLVAPFQKMADDLTPYYQERLRWISPLQRQIVELLCREHRTLNPKEIARRLLGDQNSIGKQVRELSNIGYLTSTKRGRETFYELSEPLMRLAYEVKEQSLLEMLIEFLRVWYRPDQMQQLRNGSLSLSTQAYIDAAYERSQTRPDPRLKLIQEELKKAEAEGRIHELAALWEERAAASNAASDWFHAGYYFNTINKDAATAINCYDKSIEIDPHNGYAWSNKGASLSELARYTEALNCSDKAIKLGPELSYPWVNKGTSLSKLGRHEEALRCFVAAIELEPELLNAWQHKGMSLQELGRYVEALSCHNKTLELDPQDAATWNNKGLSLDKLGRHEEALGCYDKAIEFDPDSAFPRFNRSEAFFSLHRWEDGFDAIRDAFSHLNDPPDYLGDVQSMFSLIFRLSEDDDRLQSRINTLVDLYQQAAEEQGFRSPIQGSQRRKSGQRQSGEGAQLKAAGTSLDSGRPATNPLSHLADGLVKSLAGIDHTRGTPAVLESYFTAIEKRVGNMLEFEIPLRLFRYGIRYLISKKESEFVELIQPERRILRQALGLEPEEPKQ